MEKYFEKFPVILYNGSLALDITQRAAVLQKIYSNPFLYYQYQLSEKERADNIADRYYNDDYMSWILYFSNKVIDPYYDWYLDQNSFNNYIIKKYNSLAGAMNKIKYYRNNWYDNQDPITIAQYNTLFPQLYKYYKPYYDNENSATPLYYVRRQEDSTIITNAIVSYNVVNGSGFVNDEVVNINFGVNTGRGQVAFANSSYVTLQHLSGFTTGTISGSSYLYGTDSNTNTIFTTAISISNNIPVAESIYWNPVTYYDYETSVNENNKSIKILNKSYSTQISEELKTLLG